MFGYTPEELEKIRRGPPAIRPWLAFLMVIPCVAVIGVARLVEIYSAPGGAQLIIDRAFSEAPFRVTLEHLEPLPGGAWNKPQTWQFAMHKLSFAPKDPLKPTWTIERARFGVPAVSRAVEGWVLHFDTLRIVGLDIRAKQQRPPPPWSPKDDAIAAILVDHVELSDAHYFAPEDPPLGLAEAKHIRGALHDLEWRPGRREVSAQGALSLTEFTTGAISVSSAVLDPFKLDRSSLFFGGSFLLGGTRATLTGEIRDFHIKSAVALDVHLPNADVARVVRTATGTDGPVEGKLDLDLKVYAGGDRPRGASLLDGKVKLRDGRIQLGSNTRYLFLDLIRVAPWVSLDPYNRVVLEDMTGRIRFTRGSVQMRELTYPAGKRDLRVDGTIQSDRLHLMVRLGPPPKRPEGTGIGMILYGNPQQQRFRLASRSDLQRERPWEPILTMEEDLPSVAPRPPRVAPLKKKR